MYRKTLDRSHSTGDTLVRRAYSVYSVSVNALSVDVRAATSRAPRSTCILIDAYRPGVTLAEIVCVQAVPSFLKMFDTERFITEVQNRICLWNIKEKSYSDRQAKRRAWEEIGEILILEWETYDTKKRNESRKLMFILLLVFLYKLVLVLQYSFVTKILF